MKPFSRRMASIAAVAIALVLLTCLPAVAESSLRETVDGVLRLDEVQPAGKRRMSGAEYRRGKRL